MKKKEPVMLSVREVSQRIGAPISTVRLWVQQGRFKDAELRESIAGPYWVIPETALEHFERPERGRPPKPKAESAKKGKAK